MLGELIGRAVGNYRIVRRLAEGGMGALYVAENTQIGGEYVVKVLRPEFSLNASTAARFVNEARASARLAHPGVVRIFDAGRLPEDGLLYMVMELLHGESLAARLRRDRVLPPDLLVEIARQIASAVGAAHAEGIVHRDIKPDNVFLVPDDAVASGQRVKVLDFGIAKVKEAGEDVSATQAGAILGTPTYMSPEQCRGVAVDARSDVYALGCVIFEMAVGRTPFDGKTAADLIIAHLQQPTPRLRALDPTLPELLDEIVQRATAKRPEARYPSMGELMRDLDRVWAPGARARSPELAAPSGTATTTLSGTGELDPPAFVDARASVDDAIPPRPRRTLPPWEQALADLTQALGDDAEVVATFLKSLFLDVRSPLPGLLELDRINLTLPRAQRFFCIVVGDETARSARELHTVTFTGHSVPLERHLAALPRGEPNVVLVVTNNPGLSQGVRRKILEYRRRWDALVLPLFVGEIRAALRRARLRQLFLERLDDLHAPVDPFGDAGPKRDRLTFIGNQRELQEVLHALDGGGAAVVVCGRPGSGKSSLLNMVELDCPATFVRVRCASIAGGDLDAIVAEVVRLLRERFAQARTLVVDAVPTAAAPDPSVDLRKTLFVAVPDSAVARDETVLVLEDADCLIDPLERDDALRDKARQLWSTVAEWCDHKRISVVVTGVRTYLLKEKQLGRRDNPLATHVRMVPLGPFPRDVCARFVAETGLAGDVELSDGAVDAVFALSGGYVDVARQICSRAFQRARARSGPLATATIDAALVDEAATELVYDDPFKQTMDCLRADERAVLDTIALKRPAGLKPLKRLVAPRVPASQVRVALDGLCRLGLVAHVRGREQVSIPLLQRWLVRDLDPDGLDREPRDWRGLILGASLAALFLVVGFVLPVFGLPPEHVEKAAHGCELALTYPRSAAADETVELRAACTCADAHHQAELVAVNQSADFAVAPEKEPRHDKAPLPCGPDAPVTTYAVTLKDLYDGKRLFAFRLFVDGEAVVDSEMQTSWWELAKARGRHASTVLATLSGVLGGIVTFSTEARLVLARLGQTFGLVRRRRRDQEG